MNTKFYSEQIIVRKAVAKMFQKHSPLGKLNNTLDSALKNINNGIDHITRLLPAKLEDLMTEKFEELTTKLAPPITETDNNYEEAEQVEIDEEERKFDELHEKLEEFIENKFENLQNNIEQKIEDKFNQILAKMEERDVKWDKEQTENKTATLFSKLKSLTSKVEKMEQNLAIGINTLQDSIDKVQSLCEWYSNWSSKHEVLLDQCYVARSDMLAPLKKFLVDQDNENNISELETKMKALNIVKIDRATRFPNSGIYVNIKNDLINRFYLEELNAAIKNRNVYEIRHNINAFIAILNKLETFKKYDIHNFVSFEKTYELKWSNVAKYVANNKT